MNQVNRPTLARATGLLLAAILVPLFLVVAWLTTSERAAASSHREAPLISQDPFADNTDTYVFVSPNDPDRILLAASWIPFEGPEGGPNYWEWGNELYYDIHVDTDGDATSDVTYTLRSAVEIGNPDTFLYNTGRIDSIYDSEWNRRQVISVFEQFAAGSEPPGVSPTSALVYEMPTAPANIGTKSTPFFQDLEAEAIYDYIDPYNGDMIKVFGGQTDDAFWVDLQVFDLLTLRGQAPPIGYIRPPNGPVDSLSGFNVHSLVLELPISRLTAAHGEPVLGVWATTRRPGMTVFTPGAETHSGDPVQVSRLGMPLVNELVLPMGLKDIFNGIAPEVDLTVYTLLQESVEDPEVGNLLCALYGVPLPGDADADCDTEYTLGTPRSGRGDIFDIFLTGMVLANDFTIQTADGPLTLTTGFNVNRPANVVPADMIRINTTISGDLCAPTPSRLGVLGGDACGFPNGRRLADDVVDIELLAVAGAAYEVLDDRDAAFVFNPALLDVLSDGVDGNDRPYRDTFPYLGVAQSGKNHRHRNAGFYLALAAGGAAALAPLALVTRRRRREEDLPAA